MMCNSTVTRRSACLEPVLFFYIKRLFILPIFKYVSNLYSETHSKSNNLFIYENCQIALATSNTEQKDPA